MQALYKTCLPKCAESDRQSSFMRIATSLRTITCSHLLCWRDIMLLQELLILAFLSRRVSPAILSLIVLAVVLLLRNRLTDYHFGGVEPFFLCTEGNPKSSL